MAFNVSTLALADTFELQFRHPGTGELLFADEAQTEPVSVVLYGASSKKYRNAVAALQNRALRRQQTKEKQTAEVLREEGINLLAQVIDSFKNFSVSEDGSVPSTESEFRAVLSNASISWVKEQIDTALADQSNFLSKAQ